jgi:CheY-like chemotaxis protein
VARILTTNNAQLFRQLGSKQFRALPPGTIEHEVVTSGAALLHAARRSPPNLVITEGLLPDGSGYDVCRAIKAEPALAATRVMLILDNPTTQEQLRRAEASRCDDIICLPAAGDELYGHLAPLLGLAETDGRRLQEKLIAELSRAAGKAITRGEVVDLAESGARLRLPERVAATGRVDVHLSRAVTGATHDLIAALSWQRQGPRGWEAGLSYAPLPSEVLARLRASCLWDVVPEGGGVLAVLRGDFVESVDFTPLVERLQLERRIQLDMAGVRRLNSVGACRWAETVQLLRGREISFLRCSLEFTSHAAMTTGMLGSGKVESTFAPYACAACGQGELRLLQMAAVLDDRGLRPPVLRCPRCGGDLEFDDIPERYFSFLTP